MSKKKVTAPLSYDPGKGRPQEYLAYLNWQEMQALQRLNGGNMERGPRGLPSFPPSDAMDPNDNQTTGTGNWTGAPGSGTTSGGAGGTTGGGSDSGSVTGGTTTGTTASSSAAGAQQASADAEAQQTAAERSAAEAARSSALAEDARKSGIASINVGPMSTPVRIGSGAISTASASAADSINQLGQKYGLPSSNNYNMPAYSGELSSYNPSITERVANYLNSNFYGDTIEGQQRANKIVDMATNAATTLSTIAVPEVRIPGIASSFIGSLAKPVVGFAERIAAPVVERIGGSGILRTTGDGEKIVSDLDEFVNWASSLPGRNTEKFKIDISKIPQYKTLSDYRSAQPGIVGKTMDKIEGAIDMATEAARLGTGTVPRALGSSMLGSYNEILNNAIHGDYNDYVSDYLSDNVRDGFDYVNSGLDYVGNYFNDPRDQEGDYSGMKDGGVVSRKKIAAPLSYDPGKGRPKEYLAYLNWQEMQELMRINGNNMERGPRGLPSFPPDDSIGSGQTTGTGNWTGSPGSGTTSSGVGGTTGGGSDSGSIGGSVSGTSTSTTSATSTAGSQQASNDTEAQQAAAEQNAAEAARNEALRQDAVRGGIASINVGPMQTPVKIGGGQIFGSISGMAQQTSVMPTMPGGGGMGQYNARRGSSLLAAGPTTGAEAFGNVAQGSLWGTSPSAARKYDSLESDLARRALFSAPSRVGSQSVPTLSAPSGVFGPRLSMDKTYYPDAPNGATIGPRQYSTPSLIESEGYVPGIGGTTDTRVTEALKKAAYDAYSAVSGYFSGPPSGSAYDVSNMPQLEVVTPDVRNAQTMQVVGGLGLAALPARLGSPSVLTNPAFDTVQRDLEYGGGPAQTKMANIDRMGPFNTAHDLGRERIISIEDVPETYESSAETQLSNVEEEYRSQPESYRVAPGDGYYTHPDGTPYTAEDIQNLPPSVYNEYMEKERMKRQGTPYKLSPEEEIKAKISGGVGKIASLNPFTSAFTGISSLVGFGMSKLPGAFGEFGEDLRTAAGKLRNPAEAVREYASANPLRQAQIAANAGKAGYVPGTELPISGTSFAGRIPTQEPGGKGNDFDSPSYGSQYAATPTVPTAARETGRPQQYYLWDLGIGVPSPGDPDYNEYQKYLRGRRSSATV